MTRKDRVPGAWLRRFAERTFDRGTNDRVILPALADLQHESSGSEDGQLRRLARSVRAYWGLWKTIGLCAIGDVALNREQIASSLSGRTLGFFLIASAVLMLPNVAWMLSFGSTYGAGTALTAGAFLLPSNVLVALPVAFFFALAMFPARVDVPSSRLIPSAVVGSVICGAVVLVLLMVVVPIANQAYRTHVFAAFQRNVTDGPHVLLKGLAEMTLPELKDHLHYHFAFVGTVFVLCLLGLALAGRWRSRLATFGVALAILVLYGLCFGFGAGLNKYGYPVAYGTWTANGAFFVFALRLLRSQTGIATLNAES
jgi:hypothetical protein